MCFPKMSGAYSQLSSQKQCRQIVPVKPGSETGATQIQTMDHTAESNTVQAHMKVNPTLAQGTLVTLATPTPKINFLCWIFGPKPV